MSSVRSRLAGLVAAVATAAVGLPLLFTTPAAAADPPVVSGVACQPGQGVTVVVDFLPAADGADDPGVEIGCAIGGQGSIGDAAAAAGFALNPTSGFVCEIDGVLAEPEGCSVYPGAFWSILVSAADGSAGGENGVVWTSASVGIDGGPVPVDQAVLFQIQPYVEVWTGPEDDRQPRFLLAELADHLGDGTEEPPTYPPASDPDALAAAGWLGRQLEGAGDVFASPGDASVIDWGLTQDAVLALASAGIGKTQIDATAARVFASGEDYIGAPAQAASNWARTAKTALTLQVSGLDPAAFPDGGGTRNLIAELRGTQNPDGSFGTSDFPFTHALALFTLSRTDGGAPAASVTWLQAQQCTTPGDAFGAYGFSGCDGVDVDGTALSVQALLAAGVPATDPSVADAQNWLLSAQQADGALPSSYGAPNTNSTALGAQTLLALGSTGQATAASGFIGSLQISCETVLDNDVLTDDTVGAIGYDAAGFADVLQYGIDGANVDQWTRATAQAMVGLGGPTFDKLTGAGAQADLPEAEVCAPPTTTTPTAPTTTSATTATTSSAPTDPPTTASSPAGTPSSTTTTTSTSSSSVSPTVTVSPGEVAPGGQIQVAVSGAPPGAMVPVELRSDPVLLGDLAIGTSGEGRASFVVPADTALGVHHIVVTVAGVEYSAALTVRLELAATGVTSATLPMTVTGTVLLFSGFGVLLLARGTRRVAGRHRP